MAQLKFSPRRIAPTLAQLIREGVEAMQEKTGLPIEHLQLAECHTSKGRQMKKMRIMGRGRTGMGYKKWSHLNVRLQYVSPQDIQQIVPKQRNPRVRQVWKRLFFERTGERLNDDGSVHSMRNNGKRSYRNKYHKRQTKHDSQKEQVEAQEVMHSEA